jgi:hypothetical protein
VPLPGSTWWHEAHVTAPAASASGGRLVKSAAPAVASPVVSGGPISSAVNGSGVGTCAPGLTLVGGAVVGALVAVGAVVGATVA